MGTSRRAAWSGALRVEAQAEGNVSARNRRATARLPLELPEVSGQAFSFDAPRSDVVPRRKGYSEVHAEEQDDVPCPVCGVYAERLHIEVKDTMFGQPGKYRLVECERCTMRYLNPRPTFAALARHYPDEYLCYTNFEKEHWLLRWAFGRLQQTQARRRVRQIEAAVGKLARGTSVLDVGCGRGELLARLQESRGCAGVGTDINPEVVARVHAELGIPTYQGTLQEIDLEYESFDLVTMTEYLEHEPQPYDVIERARQLVKPAGFIAIEVPDITGPPGRWFGENWWQIDTPRHLNFFSPQTLSELLQRQGFEVMRIERYGMLTSMGYSLLQAMGLHYFGASKLAYLTLSAALGLPFVPFLRWLPDFMMVVARRR
jgi:SAM-dependent methyltransferase